MEQNRSYLGTGMKFPPQVNPATGRFEMVSAEESVKEAIYLILMTQKRERFIHPNFGSSLLNFTFMENNQAMLNLMLADLERDIRRNEPRVENVAVRLDSEEKEGCLFFSVDYTIKENHSQENLTVPFYLKD